MRKLISVILIVSVLCACYSICLADDFSVRGGVNFNSNKQEILAYEKSVSSEIIENQTGDSLSDYYTDNCVVCDGISYAGYNNCRVIYYFDNNDNLLSILYVVRFFGEDGAKKVPDAYSRLNNALNDKYGSIIEKPISFTKDNNAYAVIEFVKGLGIFGYAKDFKQRLFSNNDYYVEIEIANVEYIDSAATSDISKFAFADVRSVAISYTKIANEVVYELYKEAEEAQNALDNDL